MKQVFLDLHGVRWILEGEFQPAEQPSPPTFESGGEPGHPATFWLVRLSIVEEVDGGAIDLTSCLEANVFEESFLDHICDLAAQSIEELSFPDPDAEREEQVALGHLPE